MTPARLAELLCAAAAQTERYARGCPADGAKTSDVAKPCGALLQLKRAVAVDGAGRVPLPSPSPAAGAALDALARLIAAGCAPRSHMHGRVMATVAMETVDAVAYVAPPRAAALAQHDSLMGALVAALGVSDSLFLAPFLEAARTAAVRVLTYASISPVTAPAAPLRAEDSAAANLRALAVALAGAMKTLDGLGLLAAMHEFEACRALTLAIAACPEAERRAFRAELAAKEGLAAALCACTARAAVALPATGAPSTMTTQMPGNGALMLAVALGSARALDLRFDAATNLLLFSPLAVLEQPPPAPLAPGEAGAPMERLLAAAPALLERAVDAVAAGAAWYGAVAAALRPGTPWGARRANLIQLLVPGFRHLLRDCWAWSVSVLELAPLHALNAVGRGGRGGRSGSPPAARLGPALLVLAEAAGAAAAIIFPIDAEALQMAALAAAAMRLFNGLARALQAGGAAPAVVLGRAPDSALATLLRLSCSELVIRNSGGPQAALLAPAARRTVEAHCRMRLSAARALTALYGCDGEARLRVAKLLAASPELAAEAGGALGAAPFEGCLARGDGGVAAARLAQRRALAAGLLARLSSAGAMDGAAPAAAAAPAGSAPWLRRLVT